MKHFLTYKRAGFTLLELMAVLAIIGILALLSVGPIRSAQQRGRDTQRKADLNLIAQAVDLYYADNRSYPTLSSCPVTSTQIVGSSVANSWIPGLDPYITAAANKQTPRDPLYPGTQYRYEFYGPACVANAPGGFTTTAGINYVLVAYLENVNDVEGKKVDTQTVYRIIH